MLGYKSVENFNGHTLAVSNEINWPLLGATRFFLAFIVLSEHLGWFITSPNVMLKFSKLSPLVAVLGFLLISGYSIAASFETRQRGFYFRRALRIIPVYVLSIVCASLAALYSHERPLIDNIYVILGNLFFMQGILVHSIESNPIVWTLSIEIFFYIITPLLVAKNKYFIYFILASALLFSSQRYLGFHYFSQMMYGLNIAFLGWAWLLGFWYYHNRNNMGAIFFVSSIGILSITINGFFTTTFWTMTWIITCVAVGYGHLFKTPFPQFFKTLGDVSYPMYLLHIPIFVFLKNFHSIQYGFLYFIIAVVLCIFIDAFIDKPMKWIIKKSVLKFL